MRRLTTSLLVLAVLLMPLASSSARAEDLVVITHIDRQTTLRREDLVQIYLRKRRFWGDGAPILPVNREAGAASRKGFDESIFGSRLRRLPNYWNREYYRGVLPPATLASDEAMRRFVASEPRAIGYIRASAVDASVHVILVLEDVLP